MTEIKQIDSAGRGGTETFMQEEDSWIPEDAERPAKEDARCFSRAPLAGNPQPRWSSSGSQTAVLRGLRDKHPHPRMACSTSLVEFYCWAVITRKEEENLLLLVKGQLHFCTTSLSFAGSALSSHSLLTFSNVVFPVLSSTGRWSESEEIIYFPH